MEPLEQQYRVTGIGNKKFTSRLLRIMTLEKSLPFLLPDLWIWESWPWESHRFNTDQNHPLHLGHISSPSLAIKMAPILKASKE